MNDTSYMFLHFMTLMPSVSAAAVLSLKDNIFF
jgi:hypothetical protein